jgi:hypothetical protein
VRGCISPINDGSEGAPSLWILTDRLKVGDLGLRFVRFHFEFSEISIESLLKLFVSAFWNFATRTLSISLCPFCSKNLLISEQYSSSFITIIQLAVSAFVVTALLCANFL